MTFSFPSFGGRLPWATLTIWSVVAPAFLASSLHAESAAPAVTEQSACKVQMSGDLQDGVATLQIQVVPERAGQEASGGIYRLLVVDAQGAVLAESEPQPVYAGKTTEMSFLMPGSAAQIQLLGPDNAVSAHLNVPARGYDRS
ncbi:MAG: hypothetical protein Q7P63_17760 [Verrucomicrobiota bacterium JB022]|nr:hypothetical protein [Verrucomicrobiota bacterium JB022]